MGNLFLHAGFLALAMIILTDPARADAERVATQGRSISAEANVGVGFLTSLDAAGMAVSGGTTFFFGRHVAFGFDLGYGVLGDAVDVQDRWWLLPTFALVLPTSFVRIEAGGSFGFGAASGYRDFAAFVDAPFDPVWAHQLVPMVRGHLQISRPVSGDARGWLRVELASLLLAGSEIGSRVHNASPRATDTLWLQLAVGTAFSLL